MALLVSVLFVPVLLGWGSFVWALLLIWLVFLSSYSVFFDSVVLVSDLFSDSLSLFMVYMSVFVLFSSYCYGYYTKGTSLDLAFIFMFVFCFLVFSSSNLFVLYLSYESSLLPILYIIVKWGSYPERSLSAMMLLVYTAVFTFPFIFLMFMLFVAEGSFQLSFLGGVVGSSVSVLFSVLVFLTFAVKLPIYGLHLWLPMAHVEAPTFGSMILAGILLKLGGVGLLRLSSIFSVPFVLGVFLGYVMIFMVYVTFVCLFQSDFKRLVAYSSVSHMMGIPLVVFCGNLMGYKTAIMLMLFHGLSSPLLFMLVGVVYSMFASRQLVSVRGVVLISPLLALVLMLAFFFTISAPPFPSFMSEVYVMVSALQLTVFLIPVFLFFSFFSMVYNLNWFTSLVFSSVVDSVKSFSVSYLVFMPMLGTFILSVNFIVLFFLLW